MGITTLLGIGFVLAIFSSTGDCVTCILSETTPVNDLIYKLRTSSPDAIFSVQDNGGYVSIPNFRRGVLKLDKDLKLLPLNSDRTRRLRVTLVIQAAKTSNTVIDFIVLVEGFGDGLIGEIITKVNALVANDNIFRPVSSTYPIYRKFHRILLKGSRVSSAISKASCSFQRALRLLIKSILVQLAVSSTDTAIHLGPQGMLSVEKIEELIGASNCLEAVSPNYTCPANLGTFRTIDGTFNNLDEVTFGAANTGFKRFVPPRYFDKEGLGEPLGAGDQPDAPDLPNPFEVTNDYIIEQATSQRNRDRTAHMFMQWGQFIDHDMTLAPESEGGDICEEIPCNGGEEDFEDPCFPILPTAGRNCIRLIRSAPVCQSEAFEVKPREQINVNTAYLDASMVYGSSLEVQNAVRNTTGNLGLLKVSGSRGDLLPLDNSELVAPNNFCLNFGGCFLAGDLRVNEQAALASIHTLFVREHNRIARQLKLINPHWDGERIYQETRKIVGALVQKITYEDWLPIAIGRGTLSRYRGYDPEVDPSISNAFATAAFRMGHSLIRPTFDFLNANFDPILPPIPLVQMFFNNTLIQRDGIDGFLLGTVGNVSQEMDNELAIGLTRQLFQRANNIGLDLAALNVQRGRDHGLPGYGTFIKECARRFPGTSLDDAVNATTFRDLRRVIRNTTVRNSLRDLYNDDPQNVDLWPAGIAETEVRGTILGPTFTCLLRDQFERLRDGDRFFYLREKVFTRQQLWAIRRTTMSRIMCDNVNGIVSISRDVFRQARRRSSCSRIPELDLSPWKESPNSCTPNPCQNNGKCRVVYGSGVKCRCPTGFTGRFCEQIAGCDPLCGTGVSHAVGTCLSTGRCFCVHGWTGPNAKYTTNNNILADHCTIPCNFSPSFQNPECVAFN